MENGSMVNVNGMKCTIIGKTEDGRYIVQDSEGSMFFFELKAAA